MVHDSTVSSTIVSKHNYVNNSDSDGYFSLSNSEAKIIRDSVISFRSPPSSIKWIYRLGDGVRLSLEETYMIASGVILADAHILS